MRSLVVMGSRMSIWRPVFGSQASRTGKVFTGTGVFIPGKQHWQVVHRNQCLDPRQAAHGKVFTRTGVSIPGKPDWQGVHRDRCLKPRQAALARCPPCQSKTGKVSCQFWSTVPPFGARLLVHTLDYWIV